MGQKVNPHGLRVGIIKDWDEVWYASKKDFSNYLIESEGIRKFIKNKLYLAGISRIVIERAAGKLKVNISTAKPGIVIGKGGTGIDDIKKAVEKMTTSKNVVINITEVKQSEIDSQLVSESIASQLEKRISFRRAMKQSINRAMKFGAKGIKIVLSGRIGGAEIARTEHSHEGKIPLQTLRADIDYGFAEANTIYGKIGVKVYIFKGEVLPTKKDINTEGGHIDVSTQKSQKKKAT
jgi:small subunit ribosomal protein S3